ncbi:carbohydrate binding domain-containing protein [Vibrio hippocampi]|uniref:CBM-cenC domain-containing protein n=1 Tax=Vibrio hippocampi TaxID=654686 RepID=A0ABN8DIF2_9VIBR|nr:carbohydrate binding domain-containing protein [Vibrio hippocampi]CAH0528845.1 hypothetical protein VHP8226_02872 [Vibrio hippocampi]
MNTISKLGLISLSVLALSAPVSANQLLKNNTFSDNTSNWWGAGGDLKSASSAGCLTYGNAGSNLWDVILGQGGFGLIKGETYSISFDIKANTNTKGVVLVQHDGAPYNQYFNKAIKINTRFENHQYSFKYSSKNDPKATFQFQLGADKPATVCIDNVSLTIGD